MKKISIAIPTRNEEDNIQPLVECIRTIFKEKLTEYDYEIIISDNKSNDGTRRIIREICKKDRKVKAIFNANSFSYSAINAMISSTGECTLLMPADFQDPPELIPDFVHKWEEGFDAVVGVKTASKENPLMFWIRKKYYSLVRKISDVNLIENFSMFALYDRKMVMALSQVTDPLIYLRGLLVEFTDSIAIIEYTQNKRVRGKSSNNIYRLYDFAMRGITSYSKVPLRMAIFTGMIGCIVGVITGLYYLIKKFVYWSTFDAGIIPLVVLIVLFGSLQMIVLGIMGEYIMNINVRVMNHPRIVEDERINFEDIES